MSRASLLQVTSAPATKPWFSRHLSNEPQFLGIARPALSIVCKSANVRLNVFFFNETGGGRKEEGALRCPRRVSGPAAALRGRAGPAELGAALGSPALR